MGSVGFEVSKRNNQPKLVFTYIRHQNAQEYKTVFRNDNTSKLK